MKKELKKGNNERIAKLKTIAQDALDNGGKPKPAIKGSDLVGSIEQSKKFQSRTSQTDYKADNARLNEEINKLNAIIALRDRSIEDFSDVLVDREKEITDLKLENTSLSDINVYLTQELTNVKSKLENITFERDDAREERDCHKVIASNLNDTLLALQSKWYVKLFGR